MKPSIFSELSLTLTYFVFSGNTLTTNSLAFVCEAKEREGGCTIVGNKKGHPDWMYKIYFIDKTTFSTSSLYEFNDRYSHWDNAVNSPDVWVGFGINRVKVFGLRKEKTSI
jgi:hypothetical protein